MKKFWVLNTFQPNLRKVLSENMGGVNLPSSKISHQLDSKKVAISLLSIAFVLIILNIIALTFRVAYGHPHVYGFVPMFDLNQEANIPTLFATLLHLFSGFCLYTIYKAKQQANDLSANKWRYLAFIFFYVGTDECVSLHELSMAPVRNLVDAEGLLYFAWVIPAAIILLALGLYFLKFFLSLPMRTKKLFFISASVFIGGALGVELPEGWWFERYGKDNFGYSFFTTLEESMEMTGSICFVYALLDYISEHSPEINLSITSNR